MNNFQTYKDFKAKYPDAIFLLRCGDFYESFENDAIDCAHILGITLSRRSQDNVKYAGFPYHALDTYLPKLIRAGRRVVICDQLEDPKLTRNLAKKGIKEIVTPNIVKENKPSIYDMTIINQHVPYRSVFVRELGEEVKVTTEEIYSSFIREGSAEDDLFYCYVPTKEFHTLSDEKFEKYVNANY